MFDPVTAAFIRSAPELPGLDPAELPQTLTERYAELVARRLRRASGEEPAQIDEEIEWPLARIADTYELVTSIHDDPKIRRAAAFVAGTAQQLLAQEYFGVTVAQTAPVLDRDRVDATIAAAVLFLAAEQYADALEVAKQIRTQGGEQEYVATLLAENIQDLAAGKLSRILERAERRPQRFMSRGSLEERSTTALLESILIGVELFSAEVLAEPVPPNAAGRFDTPRSAIARVLELSTNLHQTGGAGIGSFLITYPGPRHLAALLLSAYDATAKAAVTRIDPPPGADEAFWKSWLRHRAATAPFVWPNHREAIEKGFHLNGNSAVMVLPTGAGKTTVSCLKIAGVLAREKSVVFIAPTHALVDQLTEDLREVFPETLLGSLVSSDFDRLFATGAALEKIEVMTPEHCLAILSYAPHAFEDVGLLVFDECHLLSPSSSLRRALDGMFCVLAFNSITPDADFLFLSAMIQNGEQFAKWVEFLTGRNCIFVDPLWKPSRQARGVVVYEESSISSMKAAALQAQREEDKAKGKCAISLRKAARAKLATEPFALFGLQHNWLQDTTTVCAITKISETMVHLNGELKGQRIRLKPNVNKVATHIAVASSRAGLKAIVFVNVKAHAVSTAKNIAAELMQSPEPTPDEVERWNALEVELGGLEHSVLSGPSRAVPHNSQMLRLERDLAERMFRRPDGAQVIVATPTLAQGLNLPAQIAILASDMRADPEDGGREALAAHEILNAAARAGRAGHLANGVVLLIAEEILTFSDGTPLDANLVRKLQSVLPRDDRCLDVSDPLQTILDRIDVAAVEDPDVEYALNRLSTAIAPEGAELEASTRFPIQKSFAAFMATQRSTTETFLTQIARLNEILSERITEADDKVLWELAAQSGVPLSTLQALRERLSATVGAVPTSIIGWASWIFDWLAEDEASLLVLLGRDRRSILGAVGRKVDQNLTTRIIGEIRPGVLAWLSGKSIRDIEIALGGNPAAKPECPRARRLVSDVVPLGFTFVFGLVGRTAQEIEQIADGSITPRSVIDCLATAIRRGFDTPSKVAFADVRRGLLSRIQIHHAFAAEVSEELDISNAEDYASLVGKMRAHLLARSPRS